MRVRFRQVASLLPLTLLAATTAQAAIVGARCPAEFVSDTRSLTTADRAQLIEAPLANEMQRGANPTETFYYIIPGTQHANGAVVVKLSNLATATQRALPDDEKLSLNRPAYETRCGAHWIERRLAERTRGGYYDDYAEVVDKQRYVNFHFYKDTDPQDDTRTQLDRFHTELGVRGSTGCMTTAEDSVRAQLLFDDVRRVATFIEHGRRFGNSLFPEVAHAQAAEYKGYASVIGQAAAILPYLKKPGSRACMAITVTLPTQRFRLEETTIMVIDADDALTNAGYPSTTPDESTRPPGSQRSWKLQWAVQ